MNGDYAGCTTEDQGQTWAKPEPDTWRETGDGMQIGKVRLDYLTLSAGLAEDGLVPIPPDPYKVQETSWQAGPYRYEGKSYRYGCGSLQHLREKEQGLILYRISGSLCEKVFPSIPLAHFRVTRIDLCLDVPREIPLRGYYQEQLDHHRGSASLIKDQTLYIGSRSSDRFWRIYDKALEQGIPGPLFRIELELKGQRAKQARSLLMLGEREKLFSGNAFGVVPGLLGVFAPGAAAGEPLDLSLPRKRKAGEKFLEKSVLPFLRANPWAVEWLVEKGVFKEYGDMQDNH